MEAQKPSAEGVAPEPAPDCYTTDFAQKLVTPRELATLFSILAPGWPLSRLPELWDNRAPLGTVKAWRYGHKRMPPWAIARVVQRLETAQDIASRLSAAGAVGCGSRALAAWRAAKRT